MSGTTLKLIALLSMLIDHVSKIFFPNIFVFTIIGRLAFPLYCFLLVEGFHYTKNIKKYILNLLTLAIISEVPYDLLFHDKVLEFYDQNVLFTLCTSLVVLFCIDKFKDKYPLILILIVFAGAATAQFLNFNYGAFGVLLCVVIYLVRGNNLYSSLAISGMNLLAVIDLPPIQAFGGLAFIPILFYNNKRGKYSFKYLFYIFYPVHLVIIYIISLMVK